MSVLQMALAKDILNNEISHAYILTGEQRFEQALCFAMSLNCRNRDMGASPCSQCLSCRKVESGNHPDIFIIEPEKGNIRVEQTRALLGKLFLEKMEGEYKIAIIRDCECLLEAAANNLLKTLEEPPEATIFLLLTEQESKLLATVRSRCRIVHLQDSQSLAADSEDNNMRKEQVQDLLLHLPAMSMYKVLSLAAEWEKDREEAIARCCVLAEQLLAAFGACFGRDSELVLTVYPSALLSAASQAQTAAEQLRANVNTRACLDMLLLRLWSLLK